MIEKIAVTNFLRYSTLLNNLQNPIKSTPAVLENDKVSNYQKYTIQYKNLQNPLISNHPSPVYYKVTKIRTTFYKHLVQKHLQTSFNKFCQTRCFILDNAKDPAISFSNKIIPSNHQDEAEYRTIYPPRCEASRSLRNVDTT